MYPIKFVSLLVFVIVFVWLFFLQMYRRSFHSKAQVIDLTSSPISKRTCHSSDDFDNRRFKTFLNFQSLSNNFESAPTVVERIVQFDTLGSTFIPKIFVDKNWANLFRNFKDPIDELIIEFYSNAWFTRAKLKCWVQGKDFIITLDYLTKILHINCLAKVDISPYDDRLAPVTEILDILGVDHEVSSNGTSIGIVNFGLELKTHIDHVFQSISSIQHWFHQSWKSSVFV